MTSIDTLQAALARGAALRPATNGFPFLAEALRQAGVRKNSFDVASATAVYLLRETSVIVTGTAILDGTREVPAYDQTTIRAAIDADKGGQTTFPEFLRRIWDGGIFRFEVDTEARTCSYFSPAGDVYLEHYPAVQLPTSASM
jgi:uncharacterized protein YbcV (DUF1398 family)